MEEVISENGSSSQQNSVPQYGVRLSVSSLYGHRKYPMSNHDS